jgi:hypothetical protein
MLRFDRYDRSLAPVAQCIERRPPEPDGLCVALAEGDPERNGLGFTLYLGMSRSVVVADSADTTVPTMLGPYRSYFSW